MAINSKLKNRKSTNEEPKAEANVKVKSSGLLWRILSRSLFAKFFIACASIMVISFIVLGTALILFSINYSEDEKEKLYLKNAQAISSNFVKMVNDAIARAAADGQRWGLTDKQIYSDAQNLISNNMQNNLPVWATNIGAGIYVTDRDGKLRWIATSETFDAKPSDTISKSVMKTIKNRFYIKQVGTLGGFFKQNNTCSGYAIVYNNSFEGAVFICSKSGGMISIISDIFNIFIFCVLFILVFSFIAIYFVTSRLVRPLRQMSIAAHSFSKGDFSARIPVSSEDEIGQLAVGFNNMATSLASLEEMRSSFVANVSHELKTPMTSISGFIDGILDGTIPPEKENQYLKIVSDEVKRLSRLVRSFLDISRIEAGEFKVNPTEFDVMEMVRRVIVGFEQPITEKSLDIRGLDNDNKFMVLADFDMIYQIVYNLVDNAVKFSGNGGYIEINVAAKSKKVYISVKNSGMGIPAADLPYVFDRFYKTDKSRSRDRKGVGLGLYIVKTELNMQGQDIVVKSVEGEFCEFVFTLKEV